MSGLQWDRNELSEYGRVLSDERLKPPTGVIHALLLSILGWLPLFGLAFLGWKLGQLV